MKPGTITAILRASILRMNILCTHIRRHAQTHLQYFDPPPPPVR